MVDETTDWKFDLRMPRRQECYHVTDWKLFQEDYRDDTEVFSHCKMDYITFCEDSIVPSKRSTAEEGFHDRLSPAAIRLHNSRGDHSPYHHTTHTD